MTDRNAPDCETPIFSAVLTPYRALGEHGFLMFMLTVGMLGFAVGVVFLLLGAWPVFGFFGLDVLLLYLAFRASYRAALAYEEVTVTPSELMVRKVSPRGEIAEWSANPLWVRLEREVHAEFGVQQVFLVARGRQFAVASFLGADEKATFASALAAAIGEAKRGPSRN
jgi:uncharacterized membrane protein